jgi:tetratricopeptide (TPR) repeat protein
MVESNGDDRPGSAEEAFALLIKLQESGQAVDFETWVGSYPQFESELREFYAYWQKIKPELEEALAGPAGPDSPLISFGAGGVAAPVELPQPRPGARIGEFILVRQIAQGGMGQVWEALQRSLGRVVALKLIRSDRIDQHALSLFEREARAGGKVNDPRIVTVYGTGESDGVRWIAEEYVVGERTLAQTLARDRKAHAARHAGDFERLADFFADVAEAMHAVHQVGVIHRDLKPGNILITAEGRPKITDFGLARVVDEASLSGQFGIAGTVHYMSPEQAEGVPRAINRRSDVFSLGVVLYEALARRRPFEGASTPEILIQITRFDPPDPRTLAPEIPKDLAHIALKALEKEPQRRYATMGELAADLRHFLAHEPIRARPPGHIERATKWARRHPTTSVACSLIAVLALAAWGFTSHAADQGAKVRDGKMRELVTLALWRIENCDLEGAAEQAQALATLLPGTSLGHRLMSVGYWRLGRFQEAEDEMKQAAGLESAHPIQGDSKQDRFLVALGYVAQRDEAGRRQAEAILSALLQEDPGFTHAWFPLYQVRKGLGDFEGAMKALTAHRNNLRVGEEDLIAVVDALILELDGNYSQALAILRPLERLSRERQAELRLARHLGRNCLLAYLHGGRTDAGLLESAEVHLDQALAEFSSDSDSWSGLGLTNLLNCSAQASKAQNEALIQEAVEHARKAQEFEPTSSMAAEVLVAAAMLRLNADFDATRPDEVLLGDLEQRLDELDRLEPDSEQGRIARSQLLYFRGAIALQEGEGVLACELFEESISIDPNQLRSHVILGGEIYIAADETGDREGYAAARAHFEEADKVWERGIPGTGKRGVDVWEPRWRFAIDVWLFGAADRSEQPELARKAREQALDWLDARESMFPEDQLNLAEFVGTAVHPELKDCTRAYDILSEFGLESRYRGNAEAEKVLAKIRLACP